MKKPSKQICVILVVSLLGILSHAVTVTSSTNYYHTDRIFTPVTKQGNSLYELLLMASQLTNIVGPTNIVILTNECKAIEYESVALGYDSPESAWDSVANNFPSGSNVHSNKYYNNPGWRRGAHDAYGDSGAWMWKLENHLVFTTSVTDVWISPYGVTNEIEQVLVATLGDFDPLTKVTDIGPSNMTAGINYNDFPGAETEHKSFFKLDLTTYYKLKPPLTIRINSPYLFAGDYYSYEGATPLTFSNPTKYKVGENLVLDPCDNDITSAVIFREDVYSVNGDEIPYSIWLKVNPDDLTNVQWYAANSHPSGIFEETARPAVARFSNAYAGGVYQWEVHTEGVVSKITLILPLAGADIISWLNTEIHAFDGWANTHLTETEEANYSAIPGVTETRMLLVWMGLSASDFDYNIYAKDTEGISPCSRFQVPSSQLYGYETVDGIVLHASKVNNMLWTLFGRYWGWTEIELKLGAHLNQLGRTRRVDGESSQNAIGLGADIFTLLQGDPSADISTILTPANLLTMQDSVELNEEKLWPSPNPVDESISILVRPSLRETP